MAAEAVQKKKLRLLPLLRGASCMHSLRKSVLSALNMCRLARGPECMLGLWWCAREHTDGPHGVGLLEEVNPQHSVAGARRDIARIDCEVGRRVEDACHVSTLDHS